MRQIIFASIIAFLSWNNAFSCANPMDEHACGIVWNNGEIVNLDTIGKLGKPDTNFLKLADGSYIFRSHEYSNAMVFLGVSLGFSSMDLLFDTSVDKSVFDPALAMGKELEWLTNAGIVVMTQSGRDSAVNAIQLKGGYNAQYYTKQGNATTFNDICFEKRTSGEQCINPPGECGLDMVFRLPIETLGLSTTHIHDLKNKGMPAINNPQSNTEAKIFDLKGTSLHQEHLEMFGKFNSRHYASGVYFVSEPGKGWIIRKIF